MRLLACAFCAALGGIGAAGAGDLTYTPISPSFGGSPLNSSHLIGLANAQRNATASDYKAPKDVVATTTPAQSDAEQFTRQLQSRLLSALASQVTDAIFGDNPQDSGTVQFGDTTVTFERTLDSIRLIIQNATDGTITEIVVPNLVTRNNTSNTLSQSTAAAATASTLSEPSITGGLTNSSASGIY